VTERTLSVGRATAQTIRHVVMLDRVSALHPQGDDMSVLEATVLTSESKPSPRSRVSSNAPEPDAVSLQEAAREASDSKSFAWIAIADPSQEELQQIQDLFGVHALAIEGVIEGDRRATAQRYGDGMACAVATVSYNTGDETATLTQLNVLTTPRAVIALAHGGATQLDHVRSRVSEDARLARFGPAGVLYAVIDEVIDSYSPAIDGLEDAIESIEDEVFGEDAQHAIARRIYDVHREVIAVERAARPLVDVVDRIRRFVADQDLDLDLQRMFREIDDHAIRSRERLETHRSLLDNALNTHVALVTQRQTEVGLAQNEQMKKVSGWAAILYMPSFVGGVYGMNFRHMPELSWVWGYPFAVGLMAGLGVGMWAIFRRAKWI